MLQEWTQLPGSNDVISLVPSTCNTWDMSKNWRITIASLAVLWCTCLGRLPGDTGQLGRVAREWAQWEVGGKTVELMSN